jgi:hypothetical protein
MEVENVSDKPIFWECRSEFTLNIVAAGSRYGDSSGWAGKAPSFQVSLGQGVREATPAETLAHFGASLPSHYWLEPGARMGITTRYPWPVSKVPPRVRFPWPVSEVQPARIEGYLLRKNPHGRYLARNEGVILCPPLVLDVVDSYVAAPPWGEAPATQDIDAMVRDVLYETYDIGTAGWSPMTGTLFVERFLELIQKQPPGQKLFAIAANGTDAQKKALLESVKRMCNIYLNELPEFQLDPNVPWQATVVHSPGVMVYPPLLLQLEDDPAQTLDIVTRMYLRMQDARAKHRRARGAREYIGWGTSDTGPPVQTTGNRRAAKGVAGT